MRYLRKFRESLVIDDRIDSNIKDIFVEYQDSHKLDVYVNKGHLPMTVVGLDDNVIEVTLFEKRGIRYADIADEVGMLIEYMKSLTDKEVKIYYRLDEGLLYYTLDGRDSSSHNTIEIYFVECVGKKLNESSQEDIDYDKVIDDINDIFVEMWDSDLTHVINYVPSGLVFLEGHDAINISIQKKKNSVIDLDLLRDCVESTADYLSDLGDFTQFYRFGYVSERVTARMTNNGAVYDKHQTRNNIEYSSFPDNFNEDVENKHALEHRFDYVLEGIKIVFQNENKVI